MRKHIGRCAHVEAAPLVRKVAAALWPLVHAHESVALTTNDQLGSNEGFHLRARNLRHLADRLAARGANVGAIRRIDHGSNLAETPPMVKAARKRVDELVEEDVTHLGVSLARIDGA
jgi:hypothetical protein